MVRVYIYEVLVITKHNFADHMKALEKVLQKLAEAGLKVKTEILFFRRTETKYLRLWVCKEQGKTHIIQSICHYKAIRIPKKSSDIHQFIRLINYYSGMWRKRAHTLDPLTKLCSTKLDFNGMA